MAEVTTASQGSRNHVTVEIPRVLKYAVAAYLCACWRAALRHVNREESFKQGHGKLVNNNDCRLLHWSECCGCSYHVTACNADTVLHRPENQTARVLARGWTKEKLQAVLALQVRHIQQRWLDIALDTFIDMWNAAGQAMTRPTICGGQAVGSFFACALYAD